MFRLQLGWPVPLCLAAIVAVALVTLAFTGLGSRTRNVAALSQHQKDCAHKAEEYSAATDTLPGKVIAIVPHYSESGHKCVVEISCEKAENGGKSLYDEIVDPETDHFIASRTREIGEQGKPDSTIISGAPVRLDDEAGAQSWFEALMK
jgi:hypothetical protein